MAASQAGWFNFFALTNLSDLADGYRLYTYTPSTTTHKIVYTDAAAAIPHTYTSDGGGGLYIALDARGELPAPLFLTAGGYDLTLKTAAGATVWTRRATGQDDGVDALRDELASTFSPADGDALIGVKSELGGAVARTQHGKNADFVSVKDFGAIGTAVPANVTADTAAFAAALASGKNVYVPEGTYYTSASLVVGQTVKLHGAGRGKTTIVYTGSGNAILLGNTDPGILLAYDPECGGFTLICTNRATSVNGVVLQNAVYFRVFDITSIGSGSPNSATPADRVLYGSGLVVSHNSILGSIERVSCRVWDNGYYFYTKATSQSHWSAAIEVHGGEVGTNMCGIMIGDPAVVYGTAVGVSFHDIWIQGNFTVGVRNYSGESTLFDSCYFEGNANYDYDLGGGAALPVKNMLHRCSMGSEDIGTTPYGTFPYISKILIREGEFNSIVENNMSITSTIPLVAVGIAAVGTRVTGNRLNSTAAATARISNTSTTTITADNAPEAPRVATRSTTRLLNAASGDVSYTGVGFRPTEIEFFAAVDASPAASFGAADASDSVRNTCISTDTSGVNLSSADCIRIIKDSAGNEQKAVLKSFDADGFTLTWTLVGAPPGNTLVINYVARR